MTEQKDKLISDIDLNYSGILMQETRRQILDILRERGKATVDDIVADLELIRGSITSVTVRHHLAKLQEDNMVDAAQMKHRATPGRPQHVYTLTDLGVSFFPNNYPDLATNLISQMRKNLPDTQVNVIIEGVADAMASAADISHEVSLRKRLDKVVEYLNCHGYEASWDTHKDGFILKTSNCPYHKVVQKDEDNLLCQMDMRLISQMLGAVPRMIERVSDGDESCTYLIPEY
ncbi:MAG: helix-turn-helix transcriptional regulator [Anaerolineae bacterium]